MLSTINELEWLRDNPHFDERPASILEFVDTGYLDIRSKVREAVMESLVDMFGEETNPDRISNYEVGMWTGGIGIGKTTIASIILSYMTHWVLCLKDPQDYFDLMPGSRIAFMMMSTSEDQAKEVIFSDVKARINYSEWFTEKYPYDANFTNQLRFQKDIWILPGDSAETTFEGYNILGGVLDEADSHKVTKTKDYAEQGYTTIHGRMTSRFHDKGFMVVIGQMKKAVGFAATKYEELKRDPKAYTRRMAIWESFGWDRYLKDDGTRDSFVYDVKRKEIVPTAAAGAIDNVNLIEVPKAFLKDFENNPEKALRDLAGIPPAVGDPFISLTYKLDEAQNRWMARYGIESPYVEGKGFLPEFVARDTLKRACHIDMAYSGDGDALGFAMGHVHEMVKTDEGELKPYIVMDCLVRIQAPPGREIFIGDIRRMIYDLRDRRKFKITKVTMDGFQSTETRQQLQRRRIDAEHVSVDKSLIPYYDLRDALYEDRLEFPKYMVTIRAGDVEKVNIANLEMSTLEDLGNKIDHPPNGSKDVSDAMAGVAFTLMGDRTYQRRQMKIDTQTGRPQSPSTPSDGSLTGRLPASAPVPDRAVTLGATSWSPPKRRR